MLRSTKSLLMIFSFLFITVSIAQDKVFTSYDLLRTKYVVETSISPDGNYIAYTLHVPRQLNDEPGNHFRYLYLFTLVNGESTMLLGDNVFVSSIGWMPDSKSITFRAKLNEDKFTQVYQLSLDSDQPFAITNSLSSVLQYGISSDGNQLAFVATSLKSKEKKEFIDKGFDAEIYEEEYLDRNLYLLQLKSQMMEPRQITSSVSVFDFQWSPNGTQIAAFIADKNLVDYSYMFKKVYLIDPLTGEGTLQLNNPGKITQMKWSPDGKHIALIASSGVNDAVTGSLIITQVPNSKKFTELKNYASGKELSIRNIYWKDENTILYRSEEGVDISLSEQGIVDAERKILIKPGMVVFSNFNVENDLISFAGNNSKHPSELYTFSLSDKKLSKLTNVNPWLKDIQQADQKKITYNARDGLEIQGILFY
ncbi:MAG: PD40 domain-containing protein, partial [Ignavibacteria bacterium]|nr:PD40 domain-containing protein [Ignavibacteria bacterium]